MRRFIFLLIFLLRFRRGFWRAPSFLLLHTCSILQFRFTCILTDQGYRFIFPSGRLVGVNISVHVWFVYGWLIWRISESCLLVSFFFFSLYDILLIALIFY